MALQRTHYQVLGISPEASEREIKRAYHNLARKLHPDKATNSDEERRLEREFAPISTAYNILKDKEKRREYDQQIEKDRGTGTGAAQASTPQRPASPSPASPAPDAAQGSAAPRRRDQDSANEARKGIARKAFARGMQFFSLYEFSKAAEYFEAAIQNDEAEGIYYARLAQCLMHNKRSFTRARDLAMKAIERDAYNTDYRIILGQICEMAGSLSLAIQAYEDALRWDAGNPKAMARLEELRKLSRPGLFSKMIGRIRGKPKLG